MKFHLTNEIFTKLAKIREEMEYGFFKVSTYQAPMVQMLKGLLDEKRNLNRLENDLVQQYEKMERLKKNIAHQQEVVSSFETDLTSLYGGNQIEKFIDSSYEQVTRDSDSQNEEVNKASDTMSRALCEEDTSAAKEGIKEVLEKSKSIKAPRRAQ